MTPCAKCLQRVKPCICVEVDKFFDENRHLMDNLAELEAREKPNARRCVACHFFDCRCSTGLRKKKI